MPSFVTGPRRGRPKRCPIDAIRTQFWFNLVSQQSRKNAYQLEKEFHLENFRRGDEWLVRPRRWDRYRDGKMVPGDDLIDRVEAVYPTPAAWFRASFWQAFKSGSLSQEEVNRQLLALDQGIPEIMFKPADSRPTRDRLPVTEEMANKLAARGDLQGLAAAILLIKESEAIASEPLRSVAINIYFRLTYEISTYPPLKEIYPYLFDHLDSQCKSWVFPSANQRLNVMIFWQGYRDQCWPPEAAEKSRELVERLEAKKKTTPEQEAFRKLFEERATTALGKQPGDS
jgi:hypothetical protein